MKRAAYLLCVFAAGAVGFFAGRAAPPSLRSGRPGAVTYERNEPRVVRIRAEELLALRERARRAATLEVENRELRARAGIEEPTPAGVAEAEPVPPPGSRRPDGSIVGGARWSQATRNMALGFLDSMVQRFFKEAHLNEEQQTRLRAELERRIDEAMQITADYINGDISADQAYAFLEAMAATSRQTVASVLDPEQLEIYRRFEKEVGTFVRGNVVNTELATLRAELGLDRAQEKRIRSILERRYRRVEERLGAPIPNMFFKPLRREMDGEIYAETGREIKRLLSPEQAAAFDRVERNAAGALYEYRSLLVPKTQ